jgi:hypothetical protein
VAVGSCTDGSWLSADQNKVVVGVVLQRGWGCWQFYNGVAAIGSFTTVPVGRLEVTVGYFEPCFESSSLDLSKVLCAVALVQLNNSGMR